MKNRTQFGVVLSSTKAFSLFVTGITEILYWVENLFNFVGLTAESHLMSHAISSLVSQSALSLTARLNGKVSTSFVSNVGFAISLIREIGKILMEADSVAEIVFISKALLRALSFFSSGATMSATAVLAQLFKLDVYDSQTLGSLDPNTLGDMDSTIL